MRQLDRFGQNCSIDRRKVMTVLMSELDPINMILMGICGCIYRSKGFERHMNIPPKHCTKCAN